MASLAIEIQAASPHSMTEYMNGAPSGSEHRTLFDTAALAKGAGYATNARPCKKR